MEANLNYNEKMFVDWITFTWDPKSSRNASRFMDYDVLTAFYFEFPELQKEKYIIESISGGLHYSHGIRYSENIMLYYDDADAKQQKGVCVMVPAHGIPVILSLFQYDDVMDFLYEIVYGRDARLSRIDITFDDYTKTFYPSYYMMKFQDGLISSHFRRFSFNGGSTSKTGEKGSEFCLGRRNSDRYLRIYNKDAESDGEKPCIRYEFELKGVVARTILKNYFDKDQKIYNGAELIFSMFRVLTADSKDKTLSRRVSDPEWEAFIKSEFGSVKLKFNAEFEPASYKRSVKWFNRQCGSTLAKVFLGEGIDYLERLIEESILKFTEKDIQSIKDLDIYYRLQYDELMKKSPTELKKGGFVNLW